MKDIFTLLTVFYIGVTYAQVGINTVTPQATLDVKIDSAVSLETANTNEGIIAPKLSKTRVANISKPTEGTLLYVDESTSDINSYTGNDIRVAKIIEKGYYYYNGKEWIGMGDKKQNIQEIKLRTTTGDTTLKIEDNGGYVYINSPTEVSLFVPDSLPIGFSCVVVEKGLGQVIVKSETAETARGKKTRKQFSAIGIIKDTNTTFTITGDAI